MRLNPRALPLVLLLASPPLLAPIYYEGAGNPLNPNTVEPAAGPARDLPAAAPLASPLIVTPTVGDDGAPAAEAVSATSAAAEEGDPHAVIDPVMCVKGMDTLQDMAMVGYQRNPSSGYMGVMVAAAMAKGQVVDGQPPNLESLRRRLHALPGGALLRDQLIQAYTLAEPGCLSAKGQPKVKAKPVVERPR